METWDAIIDGNKLVRLNADEIKALRTGDTRFVRLTRLYEPKPKVTYKGMATMYVTMADRKVNGGKRGQTESVAVTLSMKDRSWADYALEYNAIERYIENGTYGKGHCLVVEDYMMEIFKPYDESAGVKTSGAAATPAKAVPVTELMRQFYEASKNAPDGSRFILIGADEVQEMSAEPKPDAPVRIETTSLFWHCECETNYIHRRGALAQCPVCHAAAEEMPDARVNETLALLDEKIAGYQRDLDMGLVVLRSGWLDVISMFKSWRAQVENGK